MTTPITNTLRHFIRVNKLTMTSRLMDRPRRDAAHWPAGSLHYTCTLRKQGRRMQVTFSMGPDHTAPPTLEQVLDALAADASGYENARSENAYIAETGGGDEESIAECRRAYAAIGKQIPSLKALLGDDEQYKQLLWNTDRL